MTTADSANIHRLLDETFSGVEMTPELQDLKEELRSNLAARVDELIAGGLDARSAGSRAIDELGDIGELIDETDADGRARERVQGASATATASAAYRLNRVRPKPAFVVGVVVAALAATIGLLLAILGGSGVLPLPAGVVIAFMGITATGIAWIVGDTLAHETTTHHPMPQMRASGYFLAAFLAAYGLGFGGLIALGALPVWCVVFAALGVVAAIVLFAFLGATQTNRAKKWVRDAERDSAITDTFSKDPAAGARFGIYTLVIWSLAFAGFVILSIIVGFSWSWLSLVAGFVVFLLVLARMLFPAK